MRALLVDPFNRTITEVDDEKWSLDAIYKAIGTDTITVIKLDGEALYLDDEGLLKDGLAVWKLRNYRSPLAGRGLILGVDEEGENAPSAIDLDLLKGAVEWTDLESTGTLTPSQEYKPDEKSFVIIGGEGVLRKRATRQ